MPDGALASPGRFFAYRVCSMPLIIGADCMRAIGGFLTFGYIPQQFFTFWWAVWPPGGWILDSPLGLTVGTKMGGTSGEFQALNGGATAATRLVGAVINPGDAGIVTVNAEEVEKVTEGGTAGGDRFLQDLDNAVVQAIDVRGGQVAA